MLTREVALYKQMLQKGVNITFVTYGDKSDLLFAETIPGITVCCNRWGLSPRRYERWLHYLHWRYFRRADLIKTNQINGADTALGVARRFHKPLVARCGYMWSKNLLIEQGEESRLAQQSLAVEKEVFISAQHIIVTSREMKASLAERFSGINRKISIVPNYVDTKLFRPDDGKGKNKKRICFIGRLAPEKNIEALLTAIEDLDIELDIIGDGPLRKQLTVKAAGNPRVYFHGRIPHEQLPNYLHRCALFVFPSLYEGHPKTPLEAMSCGLPVVGTDVSGVREVVRDGRTGVLCGPDPRSIRETLQKVLGDTVFREKLGAAAREFVVQYFSLEKIVKQEMEVYRLVLGK